jgi:hypothetical protein
MSPGSYLFSIAGIVRRAGLDKVCLGDPRHTFASLMFMWGVKAKIISEAL